MIRARSFRKEGITHEYELQRTELAQALEGLMLRWRTRHATMSTFEIVEPGERAGSASLPYLRVQSVSDGERELVLRTLQAAFKRKLGDRRRIIHGACSICGQPPNSQHAVRKLAICGCVLHATCLKAHIRLNIAPRHEPGVIRVAPLPVLCPNANGLKCQGVVLPNDDCMRHRADFSPYDMQQFLLARMAVTVATPD